MVSLLLCALPFIAALTSGFCRSQRVLHVIARSTVFLQLGLLFMMIGSLVAGGDQFWGGLLLNELLAPLEARIALPGTSSPVIGGVHLLSQIGADAVGLPSLLLLLCGCSIVLFYQNTSHNRPRLFFVLLLLLNGCAVGTITAVNVLLLTLFAGASLTLSLAIVYLWGRNERGGNEAGGNKTGKNERGQATRRFFPIGYGAVLLLGMVLFNLSTELREESLRTQNVSQRFSLSSLAEHEAQRQHYQDESELRQSDGSVRFSSFAVLLLPTLLLMLFPLHSSFGSVVNTSPRSMVPLFLVLGPAIGFPILVRVSLWIFPGFWNADTGSTTLSVLGICTALYAALVAIGERDVYRILRFILTGWCGLTLAMLTESGRGWGGPGLSAILICGLLVMALYVTYGDTDVVSRSTLADNSPGKNSGAIKKSLVYRIAVVFLGGLPLITGISIALVEAGRSGFAETAAHTIDVWTVAGVAIGALLLMIAAFRLYAYIPERAGHANIIADRTGGYRAIRKKAVAGMMFLIVCCTVAGVWLNMEYAGPLLEEVLERDRGESRVLGQLREDWSGSGWYEQREDGLNNNV